MVEFHVHKFATHEQCARTEICLIERNNFCKKLVNCDPPP